MLLSMMKADLLFSLSAFFFFFPFFLFKTFRVCVCKGYLSLFALSGYSKLTSGGKDSLINLG